MAFISPDTIQLALSLKNISIFISRFLRAHAALNAANSMWMQNQAEGHCERWEACVIGIPEDNVNNLHVQIFRDFDIATPAKNTYKKSNVLINIVYD
jgi:hypothetical protein